MAKAKATNQPKAKGTSKSSAGKAVVAPRKPLWRRINRHQVFAVHVILFIAGSVLNWSLRAPVPAKQFDTLLWLAVLCMHGIFIYHRRRVVFVLHLFMFSAGNAAIWATSAASGEKMALTLGWIVLAGGVGIFLFRRYALAHPGIAEYVAPQPDEVYDEAPYYEEPPTPKPKKARSERDYAPPGYFDEDTPQHEYEHGEYSQPHYAGDDVDYTEDNEGMSFPEPAPKRRGRKKKTDAGE